MMKEVVKKLLLPVLLTSAAMPALGGGSLQELKNEIRFHNRHGTRDVIVVAPRNRIVRNNIIVHRPYGHSYVGYGHHYHDDDAWKWLSFTAITIKLLDNLNESAQRQHEAAQIQATTAPVGEKIVWDEGNSSGYVVATKEGTSAQTGLVCREYQQSITVGGQIEQAYGQACLQPDGSWQIVN